MNNNLANRFSGTVTGLNALVSIISLIYIGIVAFFGMNPDVVRDMNGPGSSVALWVGLMCATAIVQLIAQGSCFDLKGSIVQLVIVGLMGARLWSYLSGYPEVIALFVAYAGLVGTNYYLRRNSPVAVRAVQYQPVGSDTSANQADAPARILDVKRATVSFKDIAGMDEVKERLLGAGTEVMQSFRKGGKARNGILLTGKPGNGKTLMAEALAGELKVPFIPMTFGEVNSQWIGGTTERVVQGFREARAAAPCLLFLDEVDSLLPNREAASNNSEAQKTTNAILTELVNLRGSGVVIVAATNFVNKLDAAAIREGRFDFKIEITPPDAKARKYLIETRARRPIGQETVETAVRRWEGFSVARICAVMEEANRAGAANAQVTFNELKLALRRVQGRQGTLPESTPVLEDLVMAKEHKDRLVSLAARMDRIEEIEAMGGSVPRGALFFGPAGTGKTLTARALAKTAKWAFLSVSGLDLLSKPERIEQIVDEASELRPCIVFIDEADDVFADRRMSSNATVTNKLLAVMDGSGGHVPDVLFIAATNHPESIDSAALRGGRFTEKIEFALPDAATIKEYLERWGATTKASIGNDVSFDRVADMLSGNPLANIKEILQMAVNNAITRLRPGEDYASVQLVDIEKAITAVTG